MKGVRGEDSLWWVQAALLSESHVSGLDCGLLLLLPPLYLSVPSTCDYQSTQNNSVSLSLPFVSFESKGTVYSTKNVCVAFARSTHPGVWKRQNVIGGASVSVRVSLPRSGLVTRVS